MAIPAKLKQFLMQQKIKAKVLKHEKAYTAQEVAAAQHVPGKQMVKSVLVKTNKGFILAVLPAIHLIDFAKLKKVAKVSQVSLGNEKDIAKAMPGFEVGAAPPFGALFELPMVVDKALSEDVEIVFNAGTHTDSIKMRYADYAKVVKPVLGEFGIHISSKKSKAAKPKAKAKPKTKPKSKPKKK